ncbi:MAG TPA: hypothetical protein VFW07_01315 [Parafilimonas sp.]|nr:hypothetical protein [Parafilimonas sp.]
MNGSFMIPEILAVSKLFKAAEGSEKPHGNISILANSFKGVNLSDLKKRKDSLIIWN